MRNADRRTQNRDPHILVLIDGDGMIFNSSFLQQGAAGGKQAATLLSEAVTRWASTNIPDYPPESKVMVRVYANLQGLAEACARAGMVDHFAKVEDFARGFTCSGTLLDFTDVGSGNHGAQAKVNGKQPRRSVLTLKVANRAQRCSSSFSTTTTAARSSLAVAITAATFDFWSSTRTMKKHCRAWPCSRGRLSIRYSTIYRSAR